MSYGHCGEHEAGAVCWLRRRGARAEAGLLAGVDPGALPLKGRRGEVARQTAGAWAKVWRCALAVPA